VCISKIEAFKDSKGKIHATERCAIESEISILTGFDDGQVITLLCCASPIVPLLQRALCLVPPKAKTPEPSSEPTTLSAGERDARRSSLLGRLQKWAQIDKAASSDFLIESGFQTLSEVNGAANELQIERMIADLDEKGIAK
jgi:hypothetical protein